MCCNLTWPKISIVTPSFNQVPYLEETINSVLLQDYPNLEYIIIDGGSIDGSVEIIKKYSKRISYWVSEADKGQSHSLNKGFSRATGEIFGYLNSDDLYEPGALKKIASVFIQNPKCKLVAGECLVFDKENDKGVFEPWWPDDISYFLKNTFSSTFAQPASFWNKSVYHCVGGFEESLHCCFDREFFLKIGLAGIQPTLVKDTIARFREHPGSKSKKRVADFHRESIKILQKYAGVCQISEDEKKAIQKRMLEEIGYLEVFTQWKNKGRTEAMKCFLSLIIRSPKLLMQRKILGQGRRLLLYGAHEVSELR
jgi:glycosyltransferase involved in cell wall biosynthesis